jgi:hypothetical protein
MTEELDVNVENLDVRVGARTSSAVLDLLDALLGSLCGAKEKFFEAERWPRSYNGSRWTGSGTRGFRSRPSRAGFTCHDATSPRCSPTLLTPLPRPSCVRNASEGQREFWSTIRR